MIIRQTRGPNNLVIDTCESPLFPSSIFEYIRVLLGVTLRIVVHIVYFDVL